MDATYAYSTLSQRLQDIADHSSDDGLTLGQLRRQLADSVFGGTLAVLALPCCLPFVYLLPQIVAVPMLVIAFQMACGRSVPWLPDSLASRSLARNDLIGVIRRILPALSFLEKLARPRLQSLAGQALRPLVGTLLTLFALCILVPVPGTNTVPGIAILISSLGVLERDGLLILAGLVLGVMWIAVLIGVIVLGSLWASGITSA